MKLLQAAIVKAKANPVPRYKFCSIVATKRGRIVSEAFNSYSKTHTLQARYGKKHTSEEACFLHSEVSAILKARGKGHSIFVARVNKEGEAALAKPCPACMAAIEQESEIKKVVYTISENEYGVIDIER